MKIFELTLFWITIAPSYYWLMYALSFIFWYEIISRRKKLSQNDLDALLLYVFIWVILWWRLGYIFFYDFWFYIKNPLEIYKFWHWWMSFHWWAIWVILMIILFSKRYKKDLKIIWDEVTSIMPIWLWLGRIWNYLNNELLWKPYSWPLAVDYEWATYFPSPLLEWFILYILVNHYYKQNIWKWFSSWIFLLFYWVFRTICELFRTPDKQIWYIIWNVTMWQLLSLPMIIWWYYLIRGLNEKQK